MHFTDCYCGRWSGRGRQRRPRRRQGGASAAQRRHRRSRGLSLHGRVSPRRRRRLGIRVARSLLNHPHGDVVRRPLPHDRAGHARPQVDGR